MALFHVVFLSVSVIILGEV